MQLCLPPMIQTMCRPSCAPPAVLLPLQHPPAGFHRRSGPGAGARPRARWRDHGLDSDNAEEYRVVGGRRRLARRWTRPGRARMALSGGWRRDASPAGCGRRWRARRVQSTVVGELRACGVEGCRGRTLGGGGAQPLTKRTGGSRDLLSMWRSRLGLARLPCRRGRLCGRDGKST
jgi:hypothetical protein